MNKKSFSRAFLALIVMLCNLTVSRAQDTLTVYAGTDASSSVPAYILYYEKFTRSQFIIPSDDLVDMNGASVSAIRFYAKKENVPYPSSNKTAAPVDVYIKEVNYTTFSNAYEPKTDNIIYYHGTLSIESNGVEGILTINLNRPYEYSGGNLLIGIENTEKADYQYVYFYGQRIDENASVYGYSDNTQSVTTHLQKFIPKTTFIYEINTSIELPSSLSATNVDAHSATLTWSGGTGKYNVEYRKESDSNWTRAASDISATTFDLTGLDYNTHYLARVQSIDGSDVSSWRTVWFSTLISCPAPTGLGVTLTPGNGSIALLSWTENGTATRWEILLNGTTYTADTNPFEVTGLTPEVACSAKVRAVNSEDDKSEWSEERIFTPTDCYELLINDGLALNDYVPVYGYYAEDYIVSQFIIPASMLSSIEWGTIKSMSFFTAQSSISWGNAQFEVYVKEVNDSVFSSAALVDWSSMEKVKNAGTLSVKDKTMVVTLDEPYLYQGSNLMIGFKETVNGSYVSSKWIGVESAGASLGGKNESNISIYNFIPKVKFSYTPGIAPSVTKPKNFSVSYTGGNSVSLNWSSSESLFDIDINGTLLENITGPCILRWLDYSTTYTVKVRAKRGEEVSGWTLPISFKTDFSDTMCEITLELTDYYGDGWSGNAIRIVDALTGTEIGTYANMNIESGSQHTEMETYVAKIPANRVINFLWETGSYPEECSFKIYDEYHDLIYEFEKNATGPIAGLFFTYTADCEGDWRKPSGLTATDIGGRSVTLSWTENSVVPATEWVVAYKAEGDTVFTEVNAGSNPFTLNGLSPETEYKVKVRPVTDDSSIKWSMELTFTTLILSPLPTGLSVSNVTTTGAALTWVGTHDSYELQYRAWTQVDGDSIATDKLKTYSYDLSAFSGTGAIAIRHYDVTDMFRLNVDDIVVTDAGGTIVFSEDFENCGGMVPDTFNNMDVDGDGETWYFTGPAIDANGNLSCDANGNPLCNGSHFITSASWTNAAGALTPDNWLVITGVELGGTLSFVARGQDAAYPGENFGVFVSVDADYVSVDNLTDNLCIAQNLQPNTFYSWSVKGILNGEHSRWASALFTTLDDIKIFVNDGDWNVAANWQNLNGNAVSVPTLDDKVQINANVYIPSGITAMAKKVSIASGSVTIGYGAQLKQGSATLKVMLEKRIENDHNYFISNPLIGDAYLVKEPNYNSVSNLATGNYDFYSFDCTRDGEEWRNYRTDPGNNFFGSGESKGLKNGEGYFYSNTDSLNLEFEGTTVSSLNNTLTKDISYDPNNTDAFNGYRLIGNPYSCNGYISYSKGATFYRLNAAGDGFDVYQDVVELTPGEGVLMQVTESGQIIYSSEAPAGTVASVGTAKTPFLPLRGMTASQDASSYKLSADGSRLSGLVADFEGEEVKVEFIRSFSSGVASTVCLPFPMTDVAGGTLYEFVDVTYDSSDGWTAIMKNANAAYMPTTADCPYLFMPDNDGSVAFRGKIDAVPSSFTAGQTMAYHTAGDLGIWTFHGTYDNITWDSSMGVVYGFAGKTVDAVHAGDFVKAKAGASVPPYRCYLTYDGASLRAPQRGVSGSSAPEIPSRIKVRLLGNDGAVTAVGWLDTESGDVTIDKWYDMSGRELDGAPMGNGMFIHNGKAVLINDNER